MACARTIFHGMSRALFPILLYEHFDFCSFLHTHQSSFIQMQTCHMNFGRNRSVREALQGCVFAVHTRMPRGGFLPRGKARCVVATCARPRRGASPLCTHACRGVACPPVVWHAVRLRRVRGLGGGRARCELTHAAGWFLPPLYGALRGCDGSILPVVGLAQGLRASCPDKVRWHRLPNRAEAGRGCFRANEWMRGSARTARSHSVVCGGRRAHHDKFLQDCFACEAVLY